MYEIECQKDERYADSFFYTAKNRCGQVMRFEVWWTTDGYFNVTFYITTKRKKGYQKGCNTGRDGVSGFVWAKKCLLDWLVNYGYRFSGDKIMVYADDDRRRLIYKRYLEPLGFKESRDKYKAMYKTLTK